MHREEVRKVGMDKREDIGHGEAWTTNMKAMFDVVLQDWQARIEADRELRAKLEGLFLSREQDLGELKLQTARSAQVNNAVINAALTKSVLGGPMEESIEGKLAAQFPASVTEMVTAFTDKMVGMVGQEAMVGIVEAILAGKADKAAE